MVREARANRSSFLKVKCPDCDNEQTVFSKASTTVKCVVCGRDLATPAGGKANLKAEIIQSSSEPSHAGRDREWPQESELVVCTVENVKDFVAFVSLDEYGWQAGAHPHL